MEGFSRQFHTKFVQLVICLFYKNTLSSVEFLGISRILGASLEYLKCKFVRIKSEISILAEVESASFFFVR
jgi:hypothetical protein